MRNIAFGIIIFFTFFTQEIHAQKVMFNHDFAPTEDYTKPCERLYRDDICLTGSWQFFPIRNSASLSKEALKNSTNVLNVTLFVCARYNRLLAQLSIKKKSSPFCHFLSVTERRTVYFSSIQNI